MESIKKDRQKLITEYEVNPVNRYQLLKNEEQTGKAVPETEADMSPKILPTMISSLQEFKIMTSQLDFVAKDKYSIKVNGDKIKVLQSRLIVIGS